MPDLVDAAQSEVQQITQRIASMAGQGGIRLSASVAKAGAGHALSLLGGLLSSARDSADEFRQTGKVSMREFSSLSTFHVQGKDALVVERALSQATERVEDRIAKNRTRSSVTGRMDNRLTSAADGKPPLPSKRDQKLMPATPDADDKRPSRPAPRR
jgi:hypothetical protein